MLNACLQQLNRADTSIDRASGTLKKMIRRCVRQLDQVVALHTRRQVDLTRLPPLLRRMYQQRVVTAAIMIVLLLLIGIILWAKLWR